MHTQLELEHYYYHGTWPSEQDSSTSSAQHLLLAGNCYDQSISSQRSIGIEAMEKHVANSVSSASDLNYLVGLLLTAHAAHLSSPI